MAERRVALGFTRSSNGEVEPPRSNHHDMNVHPQSRLQVGAPKRSSQKRQGAGALRDATRGRTPRNHARASRSAVALYRFPRARRDRKSRTQNPKSENQQPSSNLPATRRFLTYQLSTISYQLILNPTQSHLIHIKIITTRARQSAAAAPAGSKASLDRQRPAIGETDFLKSRT